MLKQKDLQRESQRSELLGGGRRRGDPSLQDEPYTDGDDRDVRERLLAGTETLSDGMLPPFRAPLSEASR